LRGEEKKKKDLSINDEFVSQRTVCANWGKEQSVWGTWERAVPDSPSS